MFEKVKITIIIFVSKIFVMILFVVAYVCSIVGDERFRLWKKVSESKEEGDDLHRIN